MADQTALDMPDGLRAPFYTVVYRYGVRIEEEHDTLEEALSYCRIGEDYGDHSTHELGDAEGFLWKRARNGSLTRPFVASPRAPKRGPFFYSDEDV